MAYPCRIWLKSECDGCGACENDGLMMGPFGQRKRPVFGDDDTGEYDPFEPDWEDE